MPTIKAFPQTGKIKAQGRVDIGNPWQYDGGRPSASCDCCDYWPLPPGLSEDLVDLGERDEIIIEHKISAPTLAFIAIGSGIATNRFQVLSGGASFVARIDVMHPLSLEYNDWGVRWVLNVAGLEEDSQVIFSSGAPFTGPFDLRFRLRIPVGLFARIRKMPRLWENPPSIWGPSTNILDLQDYHDAYLKWVAFPWKQGTLEIECQQWNNFSIARTFTPKFTGQEIGSWEASGRYFNVDLLNPDTPAVIEFTGWNAPDWPGSDTTYWRYQNVSGLRSVATGRRLSVYPAGASYQGDSIEYTVDLTPEQRLRIEADCRRMDGSSWPTGKFGVQTYDGPPWWNSIYGWNTEVDTEWPRQSGPTPAEPIQISAPGTWDKTGRKIAYSVVANFDSPRSPVEVASYNLNTIGPPPRLGFTYLPSSLASAGQLQEAWRFPLTPDILACSWPAVAFREMASDIVDVFTTLDNWSAGAGTGLQLVAGGMRIYGTGDPLVAQGVFDVSPIQHARFLKIHTSASGPRTLTLKIGTKIWQKSVAPGVQTTTFDLCRPDNKTGAATHTMRVEAHSASEPDWAWGVDDPVLLRLEVDDEIIVSLIEVVQDDGLGHVVACESIHQEDRFSVEMTNNRTMYIRGVGQYSLDGRVCAELLAGNAIKDPNSLFGDIAIPTQKLTIHQSALQCTNGKGLVRIESLRPPVGTVSVLDGVPYWLPERWFSNRRPATWLRPSFSRFDLATDGVTLVADALFDRVECGTGVALTFKSRRFIGPAAAGLIEQPPARLLRGSNEVDNDNRRIYYMPHIKTLEMQDGETLTLIPGTVGVRLWHGTVSRASWRN